MATSMTPSTFSSLNNPDSGSDAIEQTTVKCLEHPADDITRYCTDHRVLCCQYCTKHRYCPGIRSIADIARGTPIREQLQEAKSDLSVVKMEVERAKKKRETNVNAHEDTPKTVLSLIQSMQNKLDILKQQTLENMNTMKKELDRKAADDIGKCDAVVTDIAKQLQELDHANPDDETRTFIDIQKALQKIEYGDTLIENMSEATEDLDLTFTVNAGAEIFLSMETLGQFTRAPCASKVKVDRMSCRKTRHDTDHTYTVRGKQNYVAKFTGDKYICDVRGSCQLSSGLILLADHKNCCLKLLNQNYQIIDRSDLRKSPFSICTIDQTTAAVCLDSFIGSTIVFASVKNNKIFICKYVEAEPVRMKAIAYFADELYTFPKMATSLFQVMKMNGSLARKVDFHTSIVWPKKMAISPDGARLYITTDSGGLVTMTRDGQILAFLNNDRLSEASGVCVDEAGNVFVTGKKSNNVCQVSRTGDKIISELATAVDGLDCPRSVCFDRINSTLVVANSGKKGCDEFHVFNVK